MNGKDQFGVGVIGCGGHGKMLAKQLVMMPQIGVLGVFDVDAKSAALAAEELDVKTFSSVENLLDAPGLEGVVIASPQITHKDLTLQAAVAEKHVFVEKPMALSTADCDEMLGVADQAGIKLCAGHCLRLMPPYRKARELIDSESLGEPLGIIVARNSGRWPGTIFSEGWRTGSESSGGLLFEVHVHELDLMRAMCGEPETVYAQGIKVVDDNLQYEDLWFVHVRFKSGAGGVLYAGMGCFIGQHYLTIQCPNGTISTNGQGGDMLLVRIDKSETRLAPEQFDDHENAYVCELRSWMEAARGGTPMIVSGFDGRQAVAMAEAAVRSSRTNSVVCL